VGSERKARRGSRRDGRSRCARLKESLACGAGGSAGRGRRARGLSGVGAAVRAGWARAHAGVWAGAGKGQAGLGREGKGEREVERAGVLDWAGVLGLLSLFYFLSYFKLTQTKTI
jgi:hypothetical protein